MGSTLKWLPPKGSPGGPVVAAAATERVPAADSPRDAKASAPKTLDGPAAGAKPQQQAPPATKLRDDLLEQKLPSRPLSPLPKGEPQLDSLPPPPRGLTKDGDSDKDALAAAPPPEKEACLGLKSFEPIKRNILDLAKPRLEQGKSPPPQSCPMDPSAFVSRAWEPVTFHWTASALGHKPVYWEDVQLERYGHTWGPWLQPVVSAGHFFLVFPALPYAMGLFPPNECVYTLGHYRPGSCAPYMLDPLPLSVRAALAEGGIWTGMIFLIP